MREIKEVFKLYHKKNKDVFEEYNKIRESRGMKAILPQSFKNLVQYGKPSVDTLEMLASAIGCPVKVFFEDENYFICPKCGAKLTVK